jgi:hypothetical protein
MFHLVLPAIGSIRGTDHIDLVLLRGHQEVGIHIAAVEQMGARQQVACGQILDDGRAHRTIGRCRRGREHLRNQIGVLWLTGLGEVELIADPLRVAFRAIAGLKLVG